MALIYTYYIILNCQSPELEKLSERTCVKLRKYQSVNLLLQVPSEGYEGL